MARLTFRLLGGLEVANEDGVVAVGAAKQRTLLTIFLLQANRVLPTALLIDRLWRGQAPASAVTTLHGYVSGLRKALRDAGAGDLLQRRSAGYVLELQPGQLDIEEFDRLAGQGRDASSSGDWATASRALAEALALWRGSALADVADEEWAQAMATRLDEARLVALDGWITAELALGRHAEIIGTIEQAVAATPLREQLSGHLMLALYRSGRQAEALRVFQTLRSALVDELGIEPTPAIVALEAAILAQEPSLDWRAASATVAMRPDVPPPDGPLPDLHARPMTNLRPSPTPLVGRATELAELSELVRHNRLVTVTGPGGAGKTRLAYEVAGRLVDGFSSGAWAVALAPVTDPLDVPAAIATALQLADPGMDAANEFLRGRMLLLIVDNCEHVIDAAAGAIEELLAANPLLFVIATSRESLAVPGEHIYAIPPLADDDAVELFVARAKAAMGDSALDVAATAAIGDICRRLDGMPLALELAAARCRAFSPQQLAARLDDRFGLLTGGARTSLPRHQTLRNVVEWSYQLLLDDERVLFERLSVMAGDYTIEAVEDICSDDRYPATMTAGTLGRLVDKSVVQVRLTTDGINRYSMLETLTQFAREHLDDDERTRLAERHAEHYGAHASVGVVASRGFDQGPWLLWVATELDNIRAALAWSVSTGAAERSAGMVSGLGWYWWASGAVHEGWRWARQVADLDHDGPAVVWATATTWATFLGACCEEHEAATPMLADADRLVRACFADDPVSITFCRGLLSQVFLLRGDLAGVRSSLAEIDQLASRLPDHPWFAATGSYTAGMLSVIDGKASDAVAALTEGARQLEQIGDLANATICHAQLALAAEANRDYDLMRAALENARRVAGELGVPALELAMAARVACATVLQGRDEEAQMLLDDVILWARDIAHRPALAYALTGLARLRYRQGRLPEAADAAREALSLPLFELVRVRAVLAEILAAAEAPDRGLPAI